MSGSVVASSEAHSAAQLLCLWYLRSTYAVLYEGRHYHRNPKHYLVLNDLPKPEESAWTALYRNRRDSAFISTMGIDCATFDHLLTSFTFHWNLLFPASYTGRPRSIQAPSSLLGLVLHYLNSPMRQRTLCQLFGYSPAVVNRAIWDSLKVLDAALATIDEAAVTWPSSSNIRKFGKIVRARWSHLGDSYPDGDVFAVMDGSSFPVAEFTDSLTQVRAIRQVVLNTVVRMPSMIAMCAARTLHAFSFLLPTVALLTLASTHLVRYACVSPCSLLNLIEGSWGDSVLAEDLYDFLHSPLNNIPAGFRIAADSAFPGTGPMSDWVVKPYVCLSCHMGLLCSRTSQRQLRKLTAVAKVIAKLKSKAVSTVRTGSEWGIR